MDYVPARILTKQASSTYAPGNDGMSGYGLAVVSRPDRLDYSMTKGGLRLWITVSLFILLLSGFNSLTSLKNTQDDELEDSDDGSALELIKTPAKDDLNTLPITTDTHSEDDLEPDQSESSNLHEDWSDEKFDEKQSHEEEEIRLLAQLNFKAMERTSKFQKKQKEKNIAKEIIEPKPSKVVHEAVTDKGVNIDELKVRKKKHKVEKLKFEEFGQEPPDSGVKEIKMRKTKGKLFDDADSVTLKLEDEKKVVQEIIETSTLKPVKMYRTKGKVDHTDILEPLAPETPPADLTDQMDRKIKVPSVELSSSSDGTVRKPKKDVKFYRTKGKLDQLYKVNTDSCEADGLNCKPNPQNLYKMDSSSNAKSIQTIKPEEKKDNKQKLSFEKPQIPVKVYRTKGKNSNNELPNTSTLKSPLTNESDRKIIDFLNNADQFLHNKQLDKALVEFDELVKKYPNSPRAHYGRANTLDALSESQRSNKILEESIRELDLVLHLDDVPEDLYILAAKRLIDRLKFRGWLKKAMNVQENLLQKFPDNLNLLKDYGISFLIMGQMVQAKRIFKQILNTDPKNGHVLALYGFVLKTGEDRIEESVQYLKQGIESDDQDAQDSRFYFHLGDALQRLNRSDESYEVYERGVEKGLFLSKYQRSVYNVVGLRSQPWWTYADTTYERFLKMIESEWKIIRDEGVALLDQKQIVFELEDEKLTNKGDWRQFTLFVRGEKSVKNCARAPKTCALIEKFPAAVTCKRGQVKFSVMKPGTRVWPHCGPTNCRVRAHLGLVTPFGPRIRVGNETRSWKKGKFIIFDDSFEHEVWYDDDEDERFSAGYRLVLIVDFWHPDLTIEQRSTLEPI